MSLCRDSVGRRGRWVAATGTNGRGGPDHAASGELELPQFGGLAGFDTARAGRAIPPRLERRAAALVPKGVGRVGARSPIGEETERPGQLEAVGGQFVTQAQRSFGIRPGQQYALAFEALETVGQDVRGDARKRSLEVVEAAWAVEERLDDEQTPAIADSIERSLERGGGRFS